MPPCHATTGSGEQQVMQSTSDDTKNEHEKTLPFKPKIVWLNVGFILVLHVMAFYGIFLLPQLKFWTMIWTIACHFAGGYGVTIGAHRLWAHRTFKAKWPLRLVIMLMNSMAAQNDIFEWSRDHRVHHKYSETDADPHNAKRGFFFSHVGWLMQRKHPDVIRKGKGIDLSDLYADSVVMFQRRHYKKISMLMCVLIPTLVPSLWGESLWNAYFTSFALRYVITLNVTWCVNSIAHMWGDKPYDVTINPAENLFVTLATSGEGYHNYHHTFPQDYAASEFGTRLNMSTRLIDMWAAMELVSDRKVVPKETIRKRMMRTGALRSLGENCEKD